LTVVSLVVTTTDATVGEGAGERLYRPDTFAEVQPKYELGLGQLVVDLTAAEFPQATAIEARLGMGDLTVRVPPGIGVDVTAEAGIGDVNVFGEDAGGFGVERHKVVSGEPMLDLDVSVGIGSIEVTR
jgi:predicted membrane protein